MAANPRWGQAAFLQAPFAPVVDGDVLPSVPWQALADGAAWGVELIVGHTRDEYRLFMAIRGELGRSPPSGRGRSAHACSRPRRLPRRPPGAGPERLYELLHSDWLFRMPSLRLAQAHHPHGSPTCTNSTGTPPAWAETLGACHGLGVPLTFGNLTAGAAAFLIGPIRRRRRRCSRTACVPPGRPSPRPATPAGPPTTARRHTWIIDTEPVVGPYPEETSRRLWADHSFAPGDLAVSASG